MTDWPYGDEVDYWAWDANCPLWQPLSDEWRGVFKEMLERARTWCELRDDQDALIRVRPDDMADKQEEWLRNDPT